MSNAVQTFTFEAPRADPTFGGALYDIRTVQIDGEPWFVAADVIRALGLSMIGGTFPHLQGLEEGTQKRVIRRPDCHEIFMGDRAGSHTIISEGGLFDKVLSAHKVNPHARQFRQWVTDVVLPSIRKHGGYIHGQEKVATGEETPEMLMARALKVADSVLKETEAKLADAQAALEERVAHICLQTYAGLRREYLSASNRGRTEPKLAPLARQEKSS